MPPGSSGCAAGGCLAGPAGALRPPKRRPGDVRPPLPPRPHLSPCPRGHALGGWGGKGGARLGDRRREGGAAAREEGEGRESRLGPSSRGRGRRRRGPGSSLGGAPSRRTRLGVRGSLARAGWKVPCRRRRASAAAAVGGVCRGGGGEGRARSEGSRGERSGERVPVAAVRRPPLVAARRPADRRSRAASSPPPPLRTATVLLSSPPARLAPRVRGRKPAPRPARPRSRPRSRGLRAPGGDPRDAAASSAVARPPPVRGRVVPRRGPVPELPRRGGSGAAARCPPPAASSGSSPHLHGGGDGSGGSVGGGVAVVRGARPVPGPCPSLPSSPAGRRGAPSAAALSLSSSPLAGPVSRRSVRAWREGGPARRSVRRPAHPRPCAPPALRDATSDQTWRPAEFKHISQRRKRN